MPDQRETSIPVRTSTWKATVMKNLARIFYRLDAPVFASRWMLYIIHIGLTICLAIYCLKFAQVIVELCYLAPTIDSEELMVRVLSAIDGAMVANLLVMINIGGYQIFIHRLHIDPRVRPQWLDHLDSMMMKVKVGVSIASITGVQVLKDFMNVEHVPHDIIDMKLKIHIVCLVSAAFFALIWKITRDNQTEHQNPPLHPALASENADTHGETHTASHEGGDHEERREDAHH